MPKIKEAPTFALQTLALCVMLNGGQRALAASIDTLSQWAGGSLDSFGDVDGNNPGATTFGETFVIHGTDALAQNLAFYIRPYYPGTAPQLCTFQVYVMEWSGSRPTGSVLFASAPLTPPSPQILSISLGNAFLKRDQKYVAFFTSDNFMDGIRSDAAMGAVPTAYADGAIVVSYSDPNFNAMFTHDWSVIFDPQYDLAFKLDYQAVPEPSAAGLIGLGGLLCLRRGSTVHRRGCKIADRNSSKLLHEGEYAARAGTTTRFSYATGLPQEADIGRRPLVLVGTVFTPSPSLVSWDISRFSGRERVCAMGKHGTDVLV